MTPYKTDLTPKLINCQGIKAVFFDVYGTMLISGTGDIGIPKEKNNEFPVSGIFKEYGLVLLSDQENIDEMFSFLLKTHIEEKHQSLKRFGITYPEVDILEIWHSILNKLIQENYLSGEINNNNVRSMALVYECMVNPVWPMPGINEVLQYLYNKNITMGIISNAQFYTEEILFTLLGQKFEEAGFDRNLTFYSYEAQQAKPSKEFFLKAVTKIKKMYNITSDEILYIGNDMINDIYTANQCGCKTALFAGDRRSLRLRTSDKRCIGLEPDIILTELVQLLNIL